MLDRRNIVDIKKQNIFIRTGKFIKTQKILLFLAVIAILVFSYANIDFDNNPVHFKNISNKVLVQNKNGKTLWEQKILQSIGNVLDRNYLSTLEKFTDINGDGKNEVIFSQCILNNPDPNNKMGWVACFNNSGKLIWKFQFTDSSSTYKDIHKTTYQNYLIDIITENGRKVLYLFADNQPLYPSVIYKLDALTGKKLPGTFWHAGHIESASIGNYSNKRQEIVASAISNCYERTVIFSINTDSLEGQAPANKNYSFEDVPQNSSLKYILLPKSDLTDFDKLRFNEISKACLTYIKEDKQFDFSLKEGDLARDAGISYRVNSELNNFKIYIGDKFQVARDTLVAKGLLQKPYSNTKEYVEILKKQIKYWDGKEFKNMY